MLKIYNLKNYQNDVFLYFCKYYWKRSFLFKMIIIQPSKLAVIFLSISATCTLFSNFEKIKGIILKNASY